MEPAHSETGDCRVEPPASILVARLLCRIWYLCWNLTLAYTFARIGAVVRLKVEDYYPSGKRFLLRFKEKGGKEKELPVHHKLEELLDEYLKATDLGGEPDSLLFPAVLRSTGKLSRRPLRRTDAADMLKRRLKQAGLPAHYSARSFLMRSCNSSYRQAANRPRSLR